MGGRRMFSEENGSFLDAAADALINAVNTVGVMGKGLALQFKKGLPTQFPRLPGGMQGWRGPAGQAVRL
jgi:hypothetical protein